MEIIEQSVQWIQEPPSNALQIIERAGRVCYKSESIITDGSAVEFVKKILGDSGKPYYEYLQNSHQSVIEHIVASMLWITNRGVTHELVRHRIASYSQESTRYCNYSKGKFGGQIKVIKPVWTTLDEINGDDGPAVEWCAAMQDAERRYMKLLELGWPAQQAREILPNSLKTEIVVTLNLREWRHLFALRAAPKAHPQMRDMAAKSLKLFMGSSVRPLVEDICGWLDANG